MHRILRRNVDDSQTLLSSCSQENAKERQERLVAAVVPRNSIITRQLAMIKIFGHLACIRNINIHVIHVVCGSGDYMEMRESDRKESPPSLIK